LCSIPRSNNSDDDDDDLAEKKKPNWRKSAKTFHRIVEQIDDEPISIVIFKWFLILIGIVMLGIVIFFMGEVIYAWTSGQLRIDQEMALANYKLKAASQRNKTTLNALENS
jgi:hypothetical protein